jgi:hypothetical protein
MFLRSARGDTMSYIKRDAVPLKGIKLRMAYPRLLGGLLGFLYGSTSTGPTYLEGEHEHLYKGKGLNDQRKLYEQYMDEGHPIKKGQREIFLPFQSIYGIK